MGRENERGGAKRERTPLVESREGLRHMLHDVVEDSSVDGTFRTNMLIAHRYSRILSPSSISI